MKLVEVTISEVSVQQIGDGIYAQSSVLASALSQAPWYQKPLASFICPESDVPQRVAYMLTSLSTRQSINVHKREVTIDDKYIAQEYRDGPA